ncbi:unnamed protein product [Effrenium voratum]|uniref:Uncharacterized protein n=1 Tax=Effrenium voratum TaxID=2562239 RepID=A0AA36N6T1_9DINO|nr:unnamed protein product [Effrenium voratum]
MVHAPLEAVLQAKLRTAFANLDDLLQLEQKLLEPNQESVSEEANARSQANVNETLPRVEGDGLSLTDEWARVPVSELVKACLQSSLSIKQAIADESIDPTEMKQVLRSLGRCSAGGGSFMKKLFTNPDAPFTFHGQLAGDATAKKNAMRKWSEAEVACGKAATHAGSASSTPDDAAHLVTEAGHCLALMGKAMVMLPVRQELPFLLAHALPERKEDRRRSAGFL